MTVNNLWLGNHPVIYVECSDANLSTVIYISIGVNDIGNIQWIIDRDLYIIM